jgi:hypothetical protein
MHKLCVSFGRLLTNEGLALHCCGEPLGLRTLQPVRPRCPSPR